MLKRSNKRLYRSYTCQQALGACHPVFFRVSQLISLSWAVLLVAASLSQWYPNASLSQDIWSRSYKKVGSGLYLQLVYWLTSLTGHGSQRYKRSISTKHDFRTFRKSDLIYTNCLHGGDTHLRMSLTCHFESERTRNKLMWCSSWSNDCYRNCLTMNGNQR